MIINHNMGAMNANRNMGINQANANKSMEKLSSGLRINKAGDDAAGLAISEKMRGQIRGLDQASANAADGISMIQTGEGALAETHSILQRMRELANQSANGTNTEGDRSSIQDEMNQLTSEVNRIGNTTEFNTQKILNGGISSNDGTKITKATAAVKTLGANMATGTVAADTSATKTLTDAATTASVATATSSVTATITLAKGTIAAGTVITIDGKDYTNEAAVTLAGAGANLTAGETDTAVALIGNSFKAADGTKLNTAANLTGTGVETYTIESKTISGGSVAVGTETSLTNNVAVTAVQGDGASIIADGKTFNLSGVAINVTDDTTKAASIALLGAKTAADGVTKLSDTVDISFDSTDHLILTAKQTGSSSSVEIVGVDAALGSVAADTGFAAKAVGTNGSKVVVDNTTFNLGGVSIDASSAATRATSIESLKNVTSGGVKLGDLVDIKDNNGKLEFTAKSSGTTSTIAFTSSAADSILGTIATDTAVTVGTATTIKGTDTTVEKAGLQAGKALSSTADISVAANSTFKIAVGTDSDVTVTLNKSAAAAIYNTSNADTNVSKAEMDRLVKDVNSALQDAGLGGKVSASLSADNKIQFISETGTNIEVKDGTNAPLAGKLGFTDKATDMGNNKNVDQVVGAGAQGSGYTTSFQIGANKGQSMSLNINDMRAAALGVTGNQGQQGFTKTAGVTNGTTNVMQESALNLLTKEDSTKAIEVLDKAIATVSTERGKLGAMQNRLEHTIANLGTSSENLTSAESRIRDVNMAKEMSTFSKNNILSQAAQAMLAQANQQPQQVLQLLR